MDDLVEAMLNSINDYVVIFDSKGAILGVNSRVTEDLGYSESDLLGKSVASLHPESFFSRAEELVKEMLAGRVKTCELPVIDKDGTVHYVETKIQPYPGNESMFIGISRDLTAKKMIEMNLSRDKKLLNVVAEMSARLLGSSGDEKQIIYDCLVDLGRSVGVDRAYVFKNHSDRENGRLLASQEFEWTRDGVTPQMDNPELQNVPYQDVVPRWYSLLSRKIPVYGAVASFPKEEREVLETQGIITLLVVPIIVEGDFWGFIGFDDCSSEREWKPSEMDILEIAARLIGSYLNTRTLEKKAKTTEEKWQLAFAGSGDFLLEYNASRNELHVAKLEKGTLSRRVFFNKELEDSLEFVHPADIQLLIEKLERVVNGDSLSLDLEIRVRIGDDYRWQIIRGSVIDKDSYGFVSRIVGTMTDVQEIVHTRDLLHELTNNLNQRVEEKTKLLSLQQAGIMSIYASATHYEALHETVDAAIKLTKMDSGGIFLINQKTHQPGISHQKGLSHHLLLKANAYLEILMNEIEKEESAPFYFGIDELQNIPVFKDEGLDFVGIIPLRSRDSLLGILLLASHTHASFSPESFKSLEAMTCSISNVLQRFDKQTALEESERRFHSLVESIREAVLVVDNYGKLISCNEATFELSGYSRQEFRKMDLKSHLLEGDIPLIECQIGKLADFSQNHSGLIETYLRKRDGDLVPVELSLSALNSHGERHIIVVVRDVTARKKLEKESRYQKDLLRKIVDTTDGPIFAISKDKSYRMINVSGAALFGMTPDQVENLKYERLIKSAAALERINRAFSNLIEGVSHEMVQDDEILDSKGNKRIFRSHLALARLEEEELIVGASNDITELVQNKQMVEEAYDQTIKSLSAAVELRDSETRNHSDRVVSLSTQLAMAMEIRGEYLKLIERGAMLHDIGKIGIPDKILTKRAPLSRRERRLIKQHPLLARDILSGIPFLEKALDIPVYHHEKWDGTGYPFGLSGESVPLSARIFAIVDVWDALTSDRPYSSAWPRERAIEYITKQSGKHFDPAIVKVFLDLQEISGTVVSIIDGFLPPED